MEASNKNTLLRDSKYSITVTRNSGDSASTDPSIQINATIGQMTTPYYLIIYCFDGHGQKVQTYFAPFENSNGEAFAKMDIILSPDITPEDWMDVYYMHVQDNTPLEEYRCSFYPQLVTDLSVTNS